jgi:aminopeptidase N
MDILQVFGKCPFFFFSVILGVWLLAPMSNASSDDLRNLIHHDIQATINPSEHTLAVRDNITVPRGFAREFTFLLHDGLRPVIETAGVRVREEKMVGHSVARSYRIILPAGLTSFVVRYKGVIYHPIEQAGKERSRGFGNTQGIISAEGVFLSGSSFWYPVLDQGFITFTARMELPAGWDAVSQGRRTLHERNKSGTIVQWTSPEPQEEIFLVAARFTEYRRSSGKLLAMVFLRTPDKALADKYLVATIRYISMYEKLIGPYPYAKFALVENFWETGFGMPSFTLLGPTIIRFPFIITSSYPHEILHNWWGNSVFPDFSTGNWSEGLTAYLSDHLLREQVGGGAEYRETTLQKYADYVSAGRDFPLREFRSRHGSSSEAIGYGKSLMFFHMLRRELGDEAFIGGLRDFYRKNIFRVASFGDIRKSFEAVSGKDLKKVFHQWVDRTGAPQIRLKDVRAFKDKDGFTLTAELEQVQQGDAYTLSIPVAVTLEGREKAYETDVNMERKSVDLNIHLSSRPLRIDVDPEFDIFRRLDREEIPPAVSQALGSKRMLVLLPSSAPERSLLAYREFAGMLAGSGPDDVTVKLDREVKEIPSDRTVTVLGWENRFLKEATKSLSGYEVSVDEKAVRIGNTEIPKKNHSIVLLGRNPKNRSTAMMFIAADPLEAIPGLGRKLPHYNKYSYLGFEGSGPDNIAKGRWPVLNSPMTAFLSYGKGISKVKMGRLAPEKPLISLPSTQSE